MSVGQFCNRDTIIARKEDTIFEAAKLMRRHHVGCVIVVEDDAHGAIAPVGIITDRDLVIEIIAQELDADKVTLGDIMTYELVIAHEDDRLWDTLQRMRVKGVRRVPVVDRHGALKGILTSDDLLEVLACEMNELAKLISREQFREMKTRNDE